MDHDPDNKRLLAAQWCCITCGSRFRLGEVIVSERLKCPKCGAMECLQPIDEGPKLLDAYYGETGPLN